jgi:hypothetical protein
MPALAPRQSPTQKLASRHSAPSRKQASTLDPGEEQTLEIRALDNRPRPGWDIGQISMRSPLVSLQTKLAMNQPGDRYEQEADRVAAQVMRLPTPGSTAVTSVVTATAPSLQRKCNCGGTCSQCQSESSSHDDEHEHKHLQTKPATPGNLPRAAAPPIVHEVLRTPGRPLDPAIRHSFESRFQHNFSNVRIHTDIHAVASARAVHAQAYTVGSHIVFNEARYAPATFSGGTLLAHELTHVVQQSHGRTAIQRAPEDDFGNIKIVKLSEIQARVARILQSPTYEIGAGRADFSASPARAKARLYHSHFRNADARVSYAMGYFQAGFGIGGDTVKQSDLAAAMVTVEVQIQRWNSDIIVHSPPTRAEKQKIKELVVKRDLEQYQFYLTEVARVQAERRHEECQRSVSCGGGAGTVDGWHQYIFDPAQEAAKVVYVDYGLPIASTLMDFVPVGGQLKVLIEGIWGQDLMTGRKLAGWERVLNIALVALPEAKGVFSAGKAGITRLAATAVDRGMNAEEVFRASRALSRLSAEDIEAARNLVVGAPANPSQLKIIEAADEIAGTTKARSAAEPLTPGPAIDKAASKAAKTVASGLDKLKTPIKLAGENHTLLIKRVGNKLRVWLCSPPPCAELALKAEAMLKKLPAKHPARGELSKLINEIHADSWIDDALELEDAQKRLDELKQALIDIEARHPGAINPDVEITPTTAEHAPQSDVHPDADVDQHPADTHAEVKHVRPEDLDPPGTEYKRAKSGQTGGEAKDDIPGWIKGDRYRNPRVGENGNTYAERLMNHKFGKGNWKEGPGTDYNKIKKWANEHFE